MPYARKRFKKRPRGRKAYKKNYRRRFKDDKINTKIERKIAQIAQKKIVDNRQLLVRMFPFGDNDSARQSSTYGFWPLPVNDASSDSTLTGQTLVPLSALAGNYYNAMYPEGDILSPTDANRVKLAFRITKTQVFLQFLNRDTQHPVDIRVSLVEVDNANEFTAVNNAIIGSTNAVKPTKYITGVVDMRVKGIFKESYENQGATTGIKHRVLKVSQFRLAPTKASSGKNDLTTSAGYRWKNLDWSVNHKGKGRKYNYASADYDANAEKLMTDKNLYLCICHNQLNVEGRVPPEIRGAAGVQYYVENNLSLSITEPE